MSKQSVTDQYWLQSSLTESIARFILGAKGASDIALLRSIMATTPQRTQQALAARDSRILSKPPPVKQQYKATKLCKFFLAKKCRRGAACNFAHTEDQLREMPDYAKTRLCVQFQIRGYCESGASCNFAHGKEEMKMATAERQKKKADEEGWKDDVEEAVVVAEQQLPPWLPQFGGSMPCQVSWQPITQPGIEFVLVEAPAAFKLNEMEDVGSGEETMDSATQAWAVNFGRGNGESNSTRSSGSSGLSTPRRHCFSNRTQSIGLGDASTVSDVESDCLTSTPGMDLTTQHIEENYRSFSPDANKSVCNIDPVIDGVHVVLKHGFIHVEESGTDSDSMVSAVAGRLRKRAQSMPARL